jgi:Fe-S-cluster containining protein
VNELAAGDFSAWLGEMQAALRGEQGSDVPCDGCTACCTASQFVHIGPEEQETLAHIPRELLFPAPRLPRGHVVLGYDERGHCPMLVDDRCSIYEHRPRACRTYDCRVFAATGLDVADDGKPMIAERARRWRFSYSMPADRAEHDALRTAAELVRRRTGELPGGAPATATQAAVLAIEMHGGGATPKA